MAQIPQRSLRLVGQTSSFLERTVGSNGEIFYDRDNTTLRIMDGQTPGGNLIAAGASVSDTPPSSPQQGQVWIKASTGVLYIWYVDVLGGQWIQPITTPVGVLEETPQLSLASVLSLGVLSVDGDSILVDDEGVISAAQVEGFSSPTLLGISTVQIPASSLNTITGATGVVVHDTSTAGTTFYHLDIANNFTANFTSVPITNNQSTTIVLVLSQGSTAYIANAVQINGSSQSITWSGGSAPTGNANSVDVMTFTLLRINNSWIVTGSLTQQGAV